MKKALCGLVFIFIALTVVQGCPGGKSNVKRNENKEKYLAVVEKIKTMEEAMVVLKPASESTHVSYRLLPPKKSAMIFSDEPLKAVDLRSNIIELDLFLQHYRRAVSGSLIKDGLYFYSHYEACYGWLLRVDYDGYHFLSQDEINMEPYVCVAERITKDLWRVEQQDDETGDALCFSGQFVFSRNIADNMFSQIAHDVAKSLSNKGCVRRSVATHRDAPPARTQNIAVSGGRSDRPGRT
eukprot:Lankesteria_metandrocarpae@DN4481_c0_g1_i1.p1